MARGFRFRLQPVLDQRQRVEEQHQARFAEHERERLAMQQQLQAIQSDIARSQHDLRDRLARGSQEGEQGGLAHVRMQANASLHLTMKAHQAALALAGAMRRLEIQRDELLKASAARKAVQLLKDKQHEAWRLEQNRREMAVLDEITSMREARRLQAELAEGETE